MRHITSLQTATFRRKRYLHSAAVEYALMHATQRQLNVYVITQGKKRLVVILLFLALTLVLGPAPESSAAMSSAALL